MTKMQRTILFAVFTIIFLILAPTIVLYSQGYRMDWEKKKITQTGAFSFKALPPRADIFVNGKLIKKTNFFLGSATTSTFLPGEYKVRIEKEGYYPWEKTLEITPRGVTEAKFIVLFPKAVTFSSTAENIEGFWPSPDQKWAIIETKSLQQVSLSIQNLATKELISLEKDTADSVKSVSWDATSQRFFIQFQSGNTRIQSISSNMQACRQIPCDLGFLEGSIEKAEFLPTQESRIVLLQNTGNSQILSAVDYANQQIISLDTNVLAFVLLGNTVDWLDATGTIWQKQLDTNSPAQKLTHTPFSVKDAQPYELFLWRGTLFIKEGKQLFRFIYPERLFEKIFDQIEFQQLDPRDEKILIVRNSELWLYYLIDEYEQPQKRRGEKVFLTRFGQPIRSPQWMNGSYIAFGLDNAIKIIETDDRDGINMVDIGILSAKKIFWDANTKSLIVLSDRTLLTSERIIR